LDEDDPEANEANQNSDGRPDQSEESEAGRAGEKSTQGHGSNSPVRERPIKGACYPLAATLNF